MVSAFEYLFNELMHSGYGGSDSDRRNRAGWQSSNNVFPGFHEYYVETLICSVGQAGCTAPRVRIVVAPIEPAGC